MIQHSILLGSLGLLAGAQFMQAQQAKRAVSETEVERVHRAAIIIDSHNDYPMRTVEGANFLARSTEGHTDLPRMKEGGITAQIFAAFVASSYVQGNRSANQCLQLIDSIKRDIVAKSPNDTVFATTADEIVAAKKSGKIAILIGIEGGHAIEDSLRLLRAFHDQGVRYMTLTHTNTNNWADSEGDVKNPAVKHHGGLTDFGRQVILEMNRLGMMVDLAHVSDETFWDVIETTKAPVFSSHSSSRALCNVTRNMTDEMILALKKNGGMININFSCDFLSQKAADASPMRNPALRKQFEEIMSSVKDPAERRTKMRALMAQSPRIRATLADVVAHINHVVKLVGIDHVGIGSDYDGIGCTPEGLDDISKWKNLTRALLQEGYSETEVHKILGGNMLRFMRSVEDAGRKLRAAAK